MLCGLCLCTLAALWTTVSGDKDHTCRDLNTTFLVTARFTNHSFDEILQPNFTSGHGQKTCLWTLRAKNTTQRIKIVVATLFLNDESDRLYVYNGLVNKDSELLGNYGPCAGGELVLYSTTSSMTIMLISNRDASRGKMRILFKALPKDWISCREIPDGTDICPTQPAGIISQDSGFLTSPFFPSSKSQPKTTKCLWRFYGLSNIRWIINIHWIGIYKEQYKNDQMRCPFEDMMRFRDPNDRQSPSIESCGCKRPSSVVSKGQELYFQVTSSPDRYRSGFVLTYRSIPLEECPASQSRCHLDIKPFGFNSEKQICTDRDTPMPTTPPPTTFLPTTVPQVTTTQPPRTTKPPSLKKPTAHDDHRNHSNNSGSSDGMIEVQKTQGVSRTSTGNNKQYVNAISVMCSKYHMTVAVLLQQIEFLRPSSLRLKDKSCSPQFSNKTHVIFLVPLDGCGTYHNTSSDRITYWNQVNGESDESDHRLITRKFKVHLNFDCSYSRKRTLSVSFSPRRKIVYSAADGRGNFTFMMDMYKTDQYKEPFDKYPVYVNLDQRLYLQILVKSQSNLAIFVDTCFATPSSNPDDNPKYDFIENGCSRDDTLRYDYKLASYQQFSIVAFRFVKLKKNPSVFLHCFVQVCLKDVNNTVCSRGCVEKSISRKRRGVIDTVTDDELEYLSLGPISFQPEDAQSTKDGVISRGLIIYIIIGALGLIVMMLTAVIVVLFKRTRKRPKRNYYRVAVN